MRIDDALGPSRDQTFGSLLDLEPELDEYKGSVTLDGEIATDRVIAFHRALVPREREQEAEELDERIPEEDKRVDPDAARSMWGDHNDRWGDARQAFVREIVEVPDSVYGRAAVIRWEPDDGTGLNETYADADKLRLVQHLMKADEIRVPGRHRAILLGRGGTVVGLVMSLKRALLRPKIRRHRQE